MLTDGTVRLVILPAYQLSGLSALFVLRAGTTFSIPVIILFVTVVLKYRSFGLLSMRMVFVVVSGWSCVCLKNDTFDVAVVSVCVCVSVE